MDHQAATQLRIRAPGTANKAEGMENPEIETPTEPNQNIKGSESLPASDRDEFEQAVLQTTELLRRLGVVACRPLDDKVEIADEV
ncbi:MAG: hypothetical protein MUO76_22855, partial [Anaerolineaceae bacterium]|nr:hypothetical protein [Anaerolineaceae bacterium]